MNDFAWHVPTRLFFGTGSFDRLGQFARELGFRRTFVITDAALSRLGVLDRATSLLAGAGLEVAGFGDAEPNPSLDNIGRAVRAAGGREWDAVVAIGGGSTLDLGKVVGVLLKSPGDPRDYAGWEKIPGDVVPVVAVPTTAGTGSEVTHVAVMADPAASLKFSMASHKILPTAAVLDPLLTVGMPRKITVSSGLDALSHGIECYTNNAHNPVSLHLAGLAIEVIGQSLQRAAEGPQDVDARYQMLLGSLVAGLAFKDKGLGLGHAMSYPLTGKYHVSHGDANGMLLPVIMEYNRDYCLDRMAEVGTLLGCPEGDQKTRADFAIRHVRGMLRSLGLPATLREWGVKSIDFEAVVDDALHERRKPMLVCNPRPFSRADVRELFVKLLG